MSVKAQAVEVEGCTMIGPSSGFPCERGNCFTVKVILENGTVRERVKLVNFNHENLEHLLKEHNLKWPIEILILKGYVAVVHDKRIPSEFYQDYFCEVCCPVELLPITQKLRVEREILQGVRTYHKVEEKSTSAGFFQIVSIDPSKSPKLCKTCAPKPVDLSKWKFALEKDISAFHSKFLVKKGKKK